MERRPVYVSDYFVEHIDPADGYTGKYRIIYSAQRNPDQTIQLQASVEEYTFDEAKNLSKQFVDNGVESPIKNLGIANNTQHGNTPDVLGPVAQR